MAEKNFAINRSLETGQQDGRACGRNGEMQMGVRRILQRESVIHQPGQALRQCLRSPHSASGAGGRSEPRRFRFDREDDRQQAKTDGERRAPKGR